MLKSSQEASLNHKPLRWAITIWLRLGEWSSKTRKIATPLNSNHINRKVPPPS